MNTNHNFSGPTVNDDAAMIERGIEAYEEATECTVTRWELADGSSTLTVEFLPPPPLTLITVEDVIIGCAESEAWFSTNSTEALA